MDESPPEKVSLVRHLIWRLPLVMIAGALMVAAHPFRYETFVSPPSFLTVAIASLGLLLFFSVVLSAPQRFHRFVLGWLGGWIYFFGVMYWLAYALNVYGDLSPFLSVAGALLLAAYLALYPAVFSLIAGSRSLQEKTPLARIVAQASLWVSLEALRQWLITGLGWGELGYGFVFSKSLLASASVFGVHGLTFVWVFAALALVNLPEIRKDVLSRRQVLSALALQILMIAAASVFGLISSQVSTTPVRISLIQPNISQDAKWSPLKAKDHIEILMGLSREAAAQNPALVVWPETAFPFMISSQQKLLPLDLTTPLVMGAVVREGSVNRNSALLVEAAEVRARFDKRHLVPFGEYVPFKELIPFGKLVANAGDFAPGNETQAPLRLEKAGLTLGPLICYEDIFSRSSVSLARQGVNLLVNLTNDAWYGPTSAQQQHAAISEMQVYQTGIPMVRSTNNGLTGYFAPFVRQEIPGFEAKSVTVDAAIPQTTSPTLFVLTYPLMEWIWAFIFVIASAWKTKSRTRRIFY